MVRTVDSEVVREVHIVAVAEVDHIAGYFVVDHTVDSGLLPVDHTADYFEVDHTVDSGATLEVRTAAVVVGHTSFEVALVGHKY